VPGEDSQALASGVGLAEELPDPFEGCLEEDGHAARQRDGELALRTHLPLLLALQPSAELDAGEAVGLRGPGADLVLGELREDAELLVGDLLTPGLLERGGELDPLLQRRALLDGAGGEPEAFPTVAIERREAEEEVHAALLALRQAQGERPALRSW